MPQPTFDDLIQHLQPILEHTQARELQRVRGRFANPQALARELLKRNWLTPFQANQLLASRGNELVLGPYILLERLGAGGMGAVFKARHAKMGRVVAIKLIHNDQLNNPQALRRFQKEIQAAARMSHPNVVYAYDSSRVGDRLLLAMEYVEGTDLAKLVKRSGPLPIATACDYVRQAALGLQHAHEHGLVHRDIKPHNLLVNDEGVVKVLDLGLARMRQPSTESSSTLTKDGSVLGTVDFVAPEQATDSHEVDIRADLYSLGCTFYYLLSGQVPFPGAEAMAKLFKHAYEQAVPVEKLRKDVPPWIAEVVRRLMEKAPADRYHTPAELAEVLRKGTPGTANRPAIGRLAMKTGGGVLLLAVLVLLLSFLFTGAGDGIGKPSRNLPGRMAASFEEDFLGPQPKPGWRYLWNKGGFIGKPANYVPLLWDGKSTYDLDGQPGISPMSEYGRHMRLSSQGGHPGKGQHVITGIEYYVIAAYTLQVGGTYRIVKSKLEVIDKEKDAFGNGVDVVVHVNNRNILKTVVNLATSWKGTFDTELGECKGGDTLYVAVGPNRESTADTFTMAYSIQKTD